MRPSRAVNGQSADLYILTPIISNVVAYRDIYELPRRVDPSGQLGERENGPALTERARRFVRE